MAIKGRRIAAVGEFDYTLDLMYRPMSGRYTPSGTKHFDTVTYGILDMINQLMTGRDIISRNKTAYDNGVTTLDRWS